MGSWMMKTGMAFALQVVICMTAFVWKFPKRKHFYGRVLLVLAVLAAGCYGTYLLRFLWPEGARVLGYTIFELIWGITILGVLYCYKVKVFPALYAAVGGYALQHLIYGLMAIIRYYAVNMPDMLSDVLYFVPYLAITLLFYMLFIKGNEDFISPEEGSMNAFVLAILVILLNVVLSRLTSYKNADATFVSVVVCRLYSVICCTMVLVELFGLFKQNSLKKDKMIMEHLLEQSKSQQRIIEDNVDFINIKCHDLKKQITSLKQIASTRERNDMIEELEQSVLIYDGIAKTGNEAIDLVLTEISWRCAKNAVRFDYVINGDDYAFMMMEDIYSMFFNALDNAIESVMEEPDQDKRMISLKSSVQGDLLYIQILNYCTVKPEFRDGLPLTTKKDKKVHGYGTKSVRYIAEKYNGSVRMTMTEESFFELEILFNRKSKKR